MYKVLSFLLLTCVLVYPSCTSTNDENKLPQEIITLITSETELRAENPSDQKYFNGEALPFQLVAVTDNVKIYIIKDSGGYFSKLSLENHFVVLQRGESYSLVFEGPSEKFNVVPTIDSVPMLEFDYIELGMGHATTRRSKFIFNGSRYELEELLLVDGTPVNVPTTMLLSIGYQFNLTEFENPPEPNYDLAYENLSLLRTTRSSKGDSLFVVKHKNTDSTTTSWLFSPKDQGYKLIQKIQDNVRPMFDSTSDLYSLEGNRHTVYSWNGSAYVMKEDVE